VSACCGATRDVSSPENPKQLGVENGVLTRARVTVAFKGLVAGETGWFTGADVDAWVAERILVPVP